VERLMNRRKQFRAVATRYDKLAERYAATITIADIFIWLRARPDQPEGCTKSDVAYELPVRVHGSVWWHPAAPAGEAILMLSKLAYLMLCRSIQVLMLLARGDAAKDLEILGRCCIWTIRGRVKLGPLSLDQIAKARSSNATVSRWPAGTSTASS
jgi:hypothetical protein